MSDAAITQLALDLNPAEGVRANMKSGLGNLAACDVGQLAAIVRNGTALNHRTPAFNLCSPRQGQHRIQHADPRQPILPPPAAYPGHRIGAFLAGMIVTSQ